MARQTYAYLGSGKIKMREFGAQAGFISIGDCSVLQFGADIDTKELKNFMQPGGGTYAKVDRVNSVTCNITVHDIDNKNLALACNGTADNYSGSQSATFDSPSYKGTTIPLPHPPSEITSVTAKGGGANYQVDTDYVMTPGGIEITVGSSITDSVGGADNITISYKYNDGLSVEAITNSGKEFDLLFEGLNEAETDKPMIVRAYRVRFAPSNSIDFIADDFAGLQLTGSVLPNLAITDTGKSQYWNAQIVV